MGETIRLGISTCPNDTFAFHGILNGFVDTEGLNFEIELADVQELNRRFLTGEWDLAKVSFHAALLVADEIFVMPSGSALGYGVGPVLLSNQASMNPEDFVHAQRSPIVLCPGELTTATLLYRLFHRAGEIRQVVFSEIMPKLRDRTADFGVCIHEGRFSYQDQGLALVEDLGTTWENKTSCPLPLGGIVGRRTIGNEVLEKAQRVIRRSIEYGHEQRQETLETMRKHAQEFDDHVLFAHVDLYVNEWTLELGNQGRDALNRLYEIGKESGIVDGSSTLDVLDH